MIPELVEALLRSVEGTAVAEIDYEADGHRLRIVRQAQGIAVAPSAPATAFPPATATAAAATRGADARRHIVCAPMHGTFYRSSAPGDPPLVEEGAEVGAGQQIALLEAMKMLHAIEAEHAGRIVKVLAVNALAVEPGTPLFEMELVEGARDV
ncbi:biotin/lipoyl-containing protein [Ramlibacter sp. WS9]|uniref:acetyl-CoA carboxylase biotin carboxyl carrier protein n=1 Tax=Ramlibacter sp. WS9 TaxID=1882741 RepID=UPI0013052D79|nr:biotin/lipoyl-containing protein [Ramlibacter sp. WS9]